MDLMLSHCFLAVHDHEEALAFYRDVLGMVVRNDVKAEGLRWLSVGPRAQPDVDIVLEPPVVDPDTSPEDKRAIAELMAKGMYGRLNFSTDDVDADFERIRRSGADVLQEPMDQPYGVRDCAFRDPSGNMLRLSQRKR
ncbi:MULTISPECIES: VOC family protein [Actinomadura]|uniref:VOC family protein n=1 Tax=Actinomadura yumaensis TaxID=111807 RepID=A0ABW2CWJ9_9ACTN|nr:VOC family protein [Actinomadura sp. J1-007]MWK37725.1 VOC family protein [Actinomadura sp. J1-007]